MMEFSNTTTSFSYATIFSKAAISSITSDFRDTFSNCSGSGVEISPEASFASKASMSRSFFLRFLSFLEGSVAVGCWAGARAGVPIGSWQAGEEREERSS